MEPNPEIEQIESLTPFQQILKEAEAEQAARMSDRWIDRWNPKDIVIGVTGGILWLITFVELPEVIQNISK